MGVMDSEHVKMLQKALRSEYSDMLCALNLD